MPKQYCPVCEQELPAGKTERELHAKLEQQMLAAEQKARKEARKELEADRKQIEADATKRANIEADRQLRVALAAQRRENQQQIADLNKQVRDAATAVQKAKAEADKLVAQRVQAELAKKEREAAADRREKQKEIADLRNQLRQADTNKTTEINRTVALKVGELKQKQIEQTSKLQETINDLNRRLEEKTNAERREEGERELLDSLKETAHPDDRYERVGHGMRGADIIQRVMDGAREAGKIVFENKNTADWNKAAFISQAKQYRTQYQTPYVIIVSRKIPNKEKQNGISVPVRGMCMIEGILVVEPHLAAPLARALRDAILEIAKLRLSKVNSDAKAKGLFDYIVGDEFQANFNAGSTATNGLKDLQDKEREWHERQWDKESKLVAEIEKSHRKINTGIQSIIKDDRKGPGREGFGIAQGLAAAD